MLKKTLIALALAPTLAFAAGGGSDNPPKTTTTTAECTDGQVWDEKTKTCVAPKESRLDDDLLYRAAREFAYAGAYGHAVDALEAMSDQNEDRVLASLGFAWRGLGDAEKSHAYYALALKQNPDNLLARSYLGQAFVAEGKIDLARAQLTEIRQRGGRQTWPEFSLREAIRTGQGYSY